MNIEYKLDDTVFLSTLGDKLYGVYTGSSSLSETRSITFTNWDEEKLDRKRYEKEQNRYIVYNSLGSWTNHKINEETTSLSSYKTIIYDSYVTGSSDTHYTETSWKPSWNAAPTIVTAQERLQQIMRDRQAPAILIPRDSTRQPMRIACDERETRARETLRRVLGDAKFQTFLRNGFVTIRAKSGLVYQIYPGHDFTSVYDQGKMVKRLCVVLSGRFPPTDSFIMRYLLILNDEAEFCKHAVSQSVINKKSRTQQVDARPLMEIFGELKAVA